MLLLQRERQTANVDASLDLLFLGTSDVGRGRNLLVVNFRVSRVLRTVQATESRNNVQPPGCDRPSYSKVFAATLDVHTETFNNISTNEQGQHGAFHNAVRQQERVICEHNGNCHTVLWQATGLRFQNDTLQTRASH